MSKHTPGPWIYEPHGGFGTKHQMKKGARWVRFPLGYVSQGHGQPIFELSPDEKEAGMALIPAFTCLPVAELDANACLMAAAPDLLKALNACVTLLEDVGLGHADGQTVATARAAIAKATEQ